MDTEHWRRTGSMSSRSLFVQNCTLLSPCHDLDRTDTPITHTEEMHKGNKSKTSCVLDGVTLIHYCTQQPCHGSLRLACGHSPCSHEFDDRIRHGKGHSPTLERQPQRKKCPSDKSQATNPIDGGPEEGLRHVVSSQSVHNSETDLEEYLRSIRDDPVALVEFLKSGNLGIQLDIEPFVNALESGRTKPLEYMSKDAGMPQLFDLDNAEPDLDPDDVSGAAITDLGKSTIYQGYNNKSPIPYQEKHVPEFIGWNCGGLPKYAMNIPLPQFSLHPPPDVAAKYHAHEPSGENAYAVSANVSMGGAVVDIHEGACHSQA